ncbi:MAG: carbohydrate porin [Phenylobacterium sp.]|uniref:carbohydrate porin n=1 Tax=Phenylobacterium sp. TaxID=1871053 RepID=UPI0012020899|nr:carbohydrate porin [Phenylobacterium sp.]TAJ72804.1 MAG: carbohydrate porin [Phenylobacterium sp.]
MSPRQIGGALAAAATAVGSAACAEVPRLPDGVTLSGGLVSETAWSVSGPGRRVAKEAGQFDLGATIDAGEVLDVTGGTVQATITYRWGEDLGAASGLRPQQLVQEIYGRGQTWRLTQLWYQQAIGSSGADLKVGRLTLGEDFATFRCAFQNLTFCGSQPGNMESDDWYNWPVSQWGARGRYKRARGYVQLGLYEVNPRNLEKDFTVGRFKGATGVMIPVEAAWTPRIHGRAGRYRLGGWYDTSRAADLMLDRKGQLRAVTGEAPKDGDGRGGAYVMAEQQVTGPAEPAEAGSGVTLFFNAAQADRRTSRIDRQVYGGAFWRGPLGGRPRDELGIAVGATRRNPRLRALTPDRIATEYVGEVFYAVRLNRAVALQPNVQLIANPGGAPGRTAAIVGLKATARLPP